MTATLQQYSCLYAVTDKTVDLYEDDVPAEMKKQTGERVGLLREMVRYGALKGMTNVFYGGTGNSPSTVNGTVSVNLLRKVTRSAQGQPRQDDYEHPGAQPQLCHRACGGQLPGVLLDGHGARDP